MGYLKNGWEIWTGGWQFERESWNLEKSGSLAVNARV